MSIIDDKIASNVLDGVINVHGTRRNLDASTDERRCIRLTPEDIQHYLSQFKYNTGIVSDGKNIVIDESVIYVRIPLNMCLVESNSNTENEHESHLYNVESQSMLNRDSLIIYVDGFKIPDSEIRFYSTISNVDVFIPTKYLTVDKEHEVIIEEKRYDLFPYIHYYEKKSSSQHIIIPISQAVKNKISGMLKGNLEKYFQIYMNRKLYNSSRTVNIVGNNIEIYITSEVIDSEIEVMFDPFIVWYFPSNTSVYNDTKNVWKIPEDYLDSLHGPLSRFSCAFFVNGLRIMNDEVDQKGRLHFEYDGVPTADNALSFYLSDRGYITDEYLKLYGKDYYLYNFIGCDAINNALHNTISGSPFIDEGANKVIPFSVMKSIGSTKVNLSLPDGVRYHEDGVQNLKIKVYKTKSVGENRYQVDTELTEVSRDDFEVNYSSNPVTVTINAPSSYMANGTTTYGFIEIDSWFSWDYVLNDNGSLFTRASVDEIISKFEKSYDHSEKVATLLRDRPYLMRTFLENFGYKNFDSQVEYNGTDAYVYFGIPDDIDKNTGKIYDIAINNKHIPNSKVTIINKDLTDVFKLEGKYFEKGTNDISIQIIDKTPVQYKKYTQDDIREIDGLRILEVKGFENLGNIENNIIVLEQVDSTDESIQRFPTSANKGYRLFTDYEFGQYDEENNIINLIFTKIPEHDFLVYNKNFSTSYAYVKPAISTVTDVVIPMYHGQDSDPVPFIPRGKIYVYCGNDKFIEGVDYFVKTPEDDPSIVGSYIIMKRIVLPGSQVDIYFSNHRTTSIYNRTGYFNNNKYGLFYLNNLRFPFSLKYMNFYINGNKLGENDIDILSDKLIRVHSIPIPMFDLVVESVFTVDDSELEPFIRQYQPDAFERYLARLFVGANYAGAYQDSGYDINEIYESFIDTVDSVNKRPNPVSRDEEWIPSYNDDETKIGPHSDGTVLDNKDIRTSLIVGNIYVVAGDKGKVASCNLDNELCKWTKCNDEVPSFQGAIFNDGTDLNNEDILSSVLFHDYIIFGTKLGHLYAYGVNSKRWYNSNDLSLLDISNSWVENTAINGFVVDPVSDVLYMYGDNGTVDGYSITDNKWFGTSYSELKPYNYSVGTTGVMGNIYDAFITNGVPYRTLVVLGEDGKTASCFIDCDNTNCWVKPDSSSHYPAFGFKPKIYSDGSYRNNSTVRSHCEYFGFKVLIGDNGIVSYFDGSFFINNDSLHICNDGSHLNNLIAHDCVSYNEKMIIVGGQDGKVSEYEGETQKWFNCDSGNGISSDGIYMEGNDIYTMQLITGNVNYIIFAGKNGKVSSHNISLSNVPYRYNPFKSAFLEWYTTPGNARIATKWEIPEEISKKFDMLLESNTDDGSGSICIRDGDDDLMVEIEMNDNNDYPWELSRRRKVLADFIHSLPDGLYSIDQIFELYKQSNIKHSLYEEDLICLKDGDDIDSDEDINITQ